MTLEVKTKGKRKVRFLKIKNQKICQRTKHKNRKRSKSKSDRSRSQSNSGNEGKLEDEYVSDTVLGMKKNIFSNLDLKCTSHGITFSKDDDELNDTTKSKSPTQQKKGSKHKIRAVMPTGPFDGEDEIIAASLKKKATSPKKTQSKREGPDKTTSEKPSKGNGNGNGDDGDNDFTNSKGASGGDNRDSSGGGGGNGPPDDSDDGYDHSSSSGSNDLTDDTDTSDSNESINQLDILREVRRAIRSNWKTLKYIRYKKGDSSRGVRVFTWPRLTDPQHYFEWHTKLNKFLYKYNLRKGKVLS